MRSGNKSTILAPKGSSNPKNNSKKAMSARICSPDLLYRSQVPKSHEFNHWIVKHNSTRVSGLIEKGQDLPTTVLALIQRQLRLTVLLFDLIGSGIK